MLPYLLALLVAVQSSAQPGPRDEIKDALARAETLYYEARFNESIKLLAGLNDVLLSKPERLRDRIAAKLQLALANIGLNDTAAAKSLLSEIYVMDPDYVLDSQQFSPKVVALANDAKNEQKQLRCQKTSDDARKHLANRDGAALLNLLGSMKPGCPELARIEPETADILYKQGLTDYKQGNFPAALQAFRSTMKLAPTHELAAQYLDLTESKLQVAEDRLLLQWQKNFDARQYKEAATDYRTLRSYGDIGNGAALNHATSEYRKALMPLVASWSQVCSIGDTSAISAVEGQIEALLPDPSFAADLRSKMAPCDPPVPAAPKVASKVEAKPTTPPNAAAGRTTNARPQPRSPVTSCFQMDPQAALTRLKSRVTPQIPREALAFLQNSQVIVKVKVRIDESGNVTAGEASGSNPMLNNAVRSAVEQWKFSPAIGESGVRCVDTELSVAVTR